jgi:hypothetical protein
VRFEIKNIFYSKYANPSIASLNLFNFNVRYRYYLFSHDRFATVHEVLHADWQEFAHSLHPGLLMLSLIEPVLIVTICFTIITSICLSYFYVHVQVAFFENNQFRHLRHIPFTMLNYSIIVIGIKVPILNFCCYLVIMSP